MRHGPRAIDIDICCSGELELRHERMSLPHEQLLSRRFVLIPALELDFALATPGGERLADALAALPARGGRALGRPAARADPRLSVGRARRGSALLLHACVRRR